MKRTLFYLTFVPYFAIIWNFILELAQHYKIGYLEFIFTIPYIFLLPFSIVLYALMYFLYVLIIIWLDPILTITIFRKLPINQSIKYFKYVLIVLTFILFIWLKFLGSSTNYIENGQPRCSFVNQPLLPQNKEYFSPDIYTDLKNQCESKKDCIINYNEYVSFGEKDESGPTSLSCCPTKTAELMYENSRNRIYPECLPAGYDEN